MDDRVEVRLWLAGGEAAAAEAGQLEAIESLPRLATSSAAVASGTNCLPDCLAIERRNRSPVMRPDA